MSNTTRSTGATGQEGESHHSPISRNEPSASREKNLDQTIEDSFPASDPPSSDPNPEGAE